MQSVKRVKQGFALPTVVIASVILFTILMIAVSSVTSVRVALNNQYYQMLGREAADSGLAHALSCLQGNNFVAQWSTASPLHPNTGCTGGAGCTNADTCFVLHNGNVRTSYVVEDVVDSGGTGIQYAKVTAKVELTRQSNGAVWSTTTVVSNAQVGGQVTTKSVVFGYAGLAGAFFATVNGDGKMYAAGYNANGQLGNGTTSNTLVPTLFQAPSNLQVVQGYTSFLSVGYTMSALMSDGSVYTAGWNDGGQLGNGTISANSPTPVKFLLPAGKLAQSVITLGQATYVLTTDGNLYAAGKCINGILGSNYTPIAGCSDQSTPVRVNLPTPNVNDSNTIPTTNIVADRYNVYVRMAGGKIYGWGDNHMGQLGNGTHTPSSNPAQYGTFGNAGQPKATQVLFDGDTVYVLLENGNMYTSGYSEFGQSGNQNVELYHRNTNKCLDNQSGAGTAVWLYACNQSINQQWLMNPDVQIIGANIAANGYKCIDNTAGNGFDLQLYACIQNANQKFVAQYGKIYNVSPGSGNVIDNYFGDGQTVKLISDQGVNVNQYFDADHTTPWPVWLGCVPTGKAIKMTTDQGSMSFMTDMGDVYSVGLNIMGQFGDGTQNYANTECRKFALPGGVKATDLYTTWIGDSITNSKYQNLMVIGSDGKVYGAGSNFYGQLGNGTTATAQNTPVAMNVVNGTSAIAKSVQVGMGTTVIFTTGGRVFTVGNNSNGQLGDGTTTNSSTPKMNKYTNIIIPKTF